MAVQHIQKFSLRVIYKGNSWKKRLQVKDNDFDKIYDDLCSYSSKRSKLEYGSQCHIMINNSVIYSSDDLKRELENSNQNILDVKVNVC